MSTEAGQVLPDDAHLLRRMLVEREALLVEREALLVEREALLVERDRRIAELEKGNAELERERDRRIAELEKGNAELELEKLRLLHQLEQLKKRYYGPRADKLDVGQLLLEFATALEGRPVNPRDLPHRAGTDGGTGELTEATVRRVNRGRRNIAALDKLPVIQKVHDLGDEHKPCPCCGSRRREIGRESTWQVEYFPGHFARVASGSSGTGSTPASTASGKPKTRRSRWRESP